MQATRVRRVTWALALLLSGVVLAPAGATERIAGQNPTVPPAQTIADDVLMAGNTLLMQGTVEGDLAAAGANVTVSGNVSGDVMAAGANVTVSAPVGDDLRAAGANVTVSGPVRDNALLAGSAIVLQPGGRIGRDADIAGGSIQVQGKVGRNLSLSGADVQLAAEVGGTVRAQVDRLRLLPGATVRGDLIVYGPRAPEISPGARVLGRVDHRVTRPAAGARAPQRGVGWLMGWLFHFFWLFVVGATGVALSHAWPDRVADVLTRRLGPAALTGFLSLVAVPVVVLVLMFTLIGIPLAVIALALFVVGTILAAPFVAFCIGRWLLTRLGRALASPYTEVAVGALVSSFLMVLPGIGWLFWLLFLVVGFGALLLERWDRRLWTGGERNGGDLAAAR